MRTAGLIVAAGRGQRLGDAVPKQYLALGGGSVLGRAVAALLAHPAVDGAAGGDPPRRPAALRRRGRRRADPRLRPPVAGCATRAGSVRAGLEALASARPSGY